MKVLITGGAGFIGYHLAKELLNHDYEVVIADDFSRGVADGFLETLRNHPLVSIASVDLTRKDTAESLGGDFDYIVHLAAIIGVQNVMQHSYQVLQRNAELTINAIAMAKRQSHLRRFVFASTSEVYAGTLKYYGLEIPTPEATPLSITPLEHPRTSYMLSKIYGEALLQQSGLPFMIVRPHNFYGPRMGMSHVIPELLQKVYYSDSKQPLTISSPTHRRTFCYIDDAVKIIRKLMESPDAEGQTLNIGNERPEVTIKELAGTILSVVGKTLTVLDDSDTPGSPVRRCPSMKKTEELIGHMQCVTLREGVQRTFDWYKKFVFDGNELCER